MDYFIKTTATRFTVSNSRHDLSEERIQSLEDRVGRLEERFSEPVPLLPPSGPRPPTPYPQMVVDDEESSSEESRYSPLADSLSSRSPIDYYRRRSPSLDLSDYDSERDNPQPVIYQRLFLPMGSPLLPQGRREPIVRDYGTFPVGSRGNPIVVID